MKKIFILLFFLFIITEQSYGQWKKLFDFGSGIRTIYFNEFSSVPLEGFVSIDGGTGKSNKLWRTLDGGKTWQLINFPVDNHGWYPTPGSFTFKNRFEGWFSEFLGHSVYRTVDGGVSWTQIIQDISESQIQYIPSTGRVILSGFPTYYYSTDGITFQPFHIPGAEWTLGIAFSDDLHGIMSTVDISPTKNDFLYTTDGGLTWNISDQLGEQYAPAGVPKTKMFYAICENDAYHKGEAGKVIRSDDGGITWKKVYQYHDKLDGVSVTGTMQANTSSVFFQTIQDTSEGIMMSQDSGSSFHSICGPPNIRDSRFYCRDSFLFAADKSGGLWLNTTGIGSYSRPQLSTTNVIVNASACAPTDTVITFTFFDSCSGVQAKLVSAELDGISNFSLSSAFTSPRTIHPDDSIRIHYIPSVTLGDKAILHLRFHLGFKDIDTSITLSGRIVANAEPHLSVTSLVLLTDKCISPDSLIIFSCYDSCTGTQAILESATIQGSKNFSLLAPSSFPRTLHSNDSLVIRYTPILFSQDTASVLLHFRLGVITRDTVIRLYGKRNALVNSAFSVSKMNLNVYKCSSADSLIIFSFKDSCTQIMATLLSAQIQGSNAFSLLIPVSFPRLSHADDSLVVSYDPQILNNDSAKLLLHFALGFEFFDTIIYLSGGGRASKENVRFMPILSTRSPQAGSVVNVLVTPDKNVAGKGLQSISFDLNYYGDLLQKISAQSVIPNTIVNVGNVIRTGKQETVHVIVTGNDITLDPKQAIVDMEFMAMLAKTKSTMITMTNLTLNGGDAEYNNCILSADTSGANFSVTFGCGDTSIYQFIRTGKVIDLISIRPNPVQNDIEIEMNSVMNQDVKIELHNALGARVYSDSRNLAAGRNSIRLAANTLSSGMYLVRIVSAKGEASQSLIVNH